MGKEENRGVFWEVAEGTGWVYFDRPERMNALTPDSLRALWGCLVELESRRDVRAVVFTGRGKAFCAGMELKGLDEATPLAARRWAREIQKITDRIAELPLPTIAAVNGVAMGLGLEICLACDLALATPSARFAFPEVRLGMIPGGGGTQRLVRLVGLRRAREMVLTGRLVDAETAEAWGLVNEVIPEAELRQRVKEWLEKLFQGERTALCLAKRCLSRSQDLDLARGLELEAESFTTCFATGEPSSRMRSFAGEKEGSGRAKVYSAGEEGPEEERGSGAPSASGRGAGEEGSAEEVRFEREEEPEEDLFE